MIEVDEHTEPAPPGADKSILRDAKRIWRRAAVRPTDRRVLLAELSDELTAADSDGLPASAVVGEEPAATLRSWSDERGLSGRALRLPLIVPVTLVGTAIGFAFLGTILYMGFTTNELRIEPTYVVVGLYAATGLLAYLLAVTCTFVMLHWADDPRSASTARWLAATLPAGAAVATAAGVGVARALGFTTEPRTFVAVIVVVCGVLAATTAAARYLATRPRAASELSTAAA
ncbi:hypothetical protein C8K36_105314 [Rhodococcus sp. OK519]|uniref:hypothetical protein n=1 Tax=Rhodococcus sp. OK519 TaxID=2135729 RepID=UPI000D3A594E|nr:hypothetical protein C8K36_105314 [Rhodococcus sp. OK519]